MERPTYTHTTITGYPCRIVSETVFGRPGMVAILALQGDEHEFSTCVEAESLTALPQAEEEPGEPRWFRMSYAYDVPHYLDFVVQARSQAEAERLAQEALDNGVFTDEAGEAYWENLHGDRVFVETADYPEAEAARYPRLADGKLVEG
jgi:hypothetical protein